MGVHIFWIFDADKGGRVVRLDILCFPFLALLFELCTTDSGQEMFQPVLVTISDESLSFLSSEAKAQATKASEPKSTSTTSATNTNRHAYWHATATATHYRWWNYWTTYGLKYKDFRSEAVRGPFFAKMHEFSKNAGISS